jgi:hypothetical protein
MKWELTENERGLERAIVKMALAAQECELSPADLITMARLTKTLQRYLWLTDIALGKKKPSRRSEAPDGSGAATAA